jgi:hypothetical protein
MAKFASICTSKPLRRALQQKARSRTERRDPLGVEMRDPLALRIGQLRRLESTRSDREVAPELLAISYSVSSFH